MKKIFAVITVTTVFLFLISGAVFANELTLQAENGKILDPAGLGFEMKGIYTGRTANAETTSPSYQAQLSYGIAPAITLSGQFSSDFKNSDSGQIMLKALFSPNNVGNGYTIYTDYDFQNSKIADYGISLWYNAKFLYAFTNLEARTSLPGRPSALVLTPGANIRLGSRLRIGGEVEIKPENWQPQELRAGVNYYFSKQIAAKFTIGNGMADQSNREYTLGLIAEL